MSDINQQIADLEVERRKIEAEFKALEKQGSDESLSKAKLLRKDFHKLGSRIADLNLVQVIERQ